MKYVNDINGDMQALFLKKSLSLSLSQSRYIGVSRFVHVSRLPGTFYMIKKYEGKGPTAKFPEVVVCTPLPGYLLRLSKRVA